MTSKGMIILRFSRKDANDAGALQFILASKLAQQWPGKWPPLPMGVGDSNMESSLQGGRSRDVQAER